NRPEFNTMMEVLRAGDTLVVHEFDRLGRNKKLTLKVLQDLKNKGVRLVALNLPTTQMQTDDNLMLETINNIVIELYTMMAQQEIETREKRQREGIDQALDKGVKFGRTAIDYPDEWETIYNMVKNKEITSVRAMGMLGLKKTTYFKLKKQYEEQIKNK
ncbi:recombinase family protein, partial [Romboutsia sp. 1001216sp1]|uniref:recombinase family protein n=3 Tax=Romboutsia TaxID=1501226 RepID=UPI00232ABC27